MFFFQAEDGIRDLVRSRGLGDVYKRQFQLDQLSIGASGGANVQKSFDACGLGCLPEETLKLSLIHI